MRKVQKAKGIQGTKFLHLLTPCNQGWKIPDDMAVRTAGLSVETNVFPLYEIEDGVRYTINHESRSLPVEKYLSVQGRFKHLNAEEINAIQAEADRNWAVLKARAAGSVC